MRGFAHLQVKIPNWLGYIGITQHKMMRIMKAALLYFALVFGAGFVLGVVRTIWLVPRLGARAAELLEMPIMLAVIIAGARWVVRRLALPSRVKSRLGMGFVALTLLLIAEFTLVLVVQGVSLKDYFANRDPVSGTVYYLMLLVFALMPIFVSAGTQDGQ